ncbi:hypothetical protein QEN19_003943 [Hanseniaspora menglaensis]
MNGERIANEDLESPLFFRNDIPSANINNYIILEKYKKQQDLLNKLLLVNYNNEEIKDIKYSADKYMELKKLSKADEVYIESLRLKIKSIEDKIEAMNHSLGQQEEPKLSGFKIKNTSSLVSKVDILKGKGENTVKVSNTYWDNEYKQFYVNVKRKQEEAEELKRQQLQKEQEDKELKLKQEQEQAMYNNPLMGLYGMDLDLNFNKTVPDASNIILNNSLDQNPIAQDSFVMGTSINSNNADIAHNNTIPKKPIEHNIKDSAVKLPLAADSDFLMNDFEFDDLDLNNANDFGQDFDDEDLDPAFF